MKPCDLSTASLLEVWVLGGLSLSRHPAVLTSPDQLASHEESRRARGAVVVHVDDGDPGQAEAVVNCPLPTRGVAWGMEIE